MTVETRTDVLLVSMPWAKLSEPSLGLGILKACLNRAGIPSEARYFNIELLRRLKSETYSGIADLVGVNEFLFSGFAGNETDATQVQVLAQRCLEINRTESRLAGYFDDPAQYIDLFLKIRDEIIPAYLDECLAEVVRLRPSVVGFTCLFDQTIASLALASRIRTALPDTLIVFGGYALEGDPGLEVLRAFDCVDVVAFGDGEDAIIAIARAAAGEISLAEAPNLAYRRDGAIVQTPRRKIALVDSPFPDYRDYFEAVERLAEVDKVHISVDVIPLETSRGCWWGQKHHCTFCGIDEDTLTYRQKPAGVVLEMLRHARETYPDSTFRLVDYILPFNYFDTVLPAVSAELPGLKLTCESKSNLSLARFRALSSAGFIAVQPGIESFSTPVLRDMRKGVSGIQNVRTLKIGKRLGIRIDWNFLYGFPQDQPDDYADLVTVAPQLYHFDPPYNVSEIFLTRFAPLQAEPHRFGLEPATHHHLYRLWFSGAALEATGFDLDRYCYFFERTWENGPDLQVYYRLLDIQARHWKQLSKDGEPFLGHRKIEGGVEVRDGRMGRDKVRRMRFGAAAGPILEAADLEIVPAAALVEAAGGGAEAARTLEALIEERVLFEEAGQCLSLSTPEAEGAFSFNP